MSSDDDDAMERYRATRRAMEANRERREALELQEADPVAQRAPLDAADEAYERQIFRELFDENRGWLLEPLGPADDVCGPWRPWDVLSVLAGKPAAAFRQGETLGAQVPDKLFMELGTRALAFLSAFETRRKAARRGTKKYLPTREELETAFGDDADIVEVCWPVIRFLEPLRRAEDDESVCLLREEARALLELMRPNSWNRPAIERRTQRIASKVVRERKETTEPAEDLANVALSPGRARDRMIANYTPNFDARRYIAYWHRCAANRLRDVMKAADGTPPRSTVRNKHRRMNAALIKTGAIRLMDEQDRLDDAARRHRDPTGNTSTAGEIAALWNRGPREVRLAVGRAIAAGAVPEKRLTGSTSYAYPLRDWKAIKPFMAKKRG